MILFDTTISLSTLLWLYGGVILLVSLFARYILREHFQKQPFSIVIFFILLMISIPILGVFLSIWMIIYMKIVKYPQKEIVYKSIHLDEFFTHFPIVKRQFGESAMHEVMNNESIPLALRLNALNVLAEHTNKENFTLIKKMLSSGNDEIRLFSFSIVDGLEQEINEKIHKALHQYKEEHATKIEKANAAKTLALLYWELIYFELADDVLIQYLLGEVEAYALEALEMFPQEYRIYFLLGKVYFEKKESEKAKTYFQKAIEIGRLNHVKNIHFIQPYIAEIAYQEKSFDSVKEIIQNTEYFELNEKLKPIQEIWTR
jgi:tetratricopeptide (TPR) repeat protein